MSRAYSDLRDLVESKLQDTSNAEFGLPEINFEIEESLKEVSGYSGYRHIVEVAFSIESRQGTATSTSANNLVDATKSQFVSTDPTNEKVVYNDTDKTWATIVSYSSTSQVGLSKDIMASGEVYYIFNKRCQNSRQLYIGDSWDYTEILGVEYPTAYFPRRLRSSRTIGRDILEFDLDRLPDDSNSTLVGQRTEAVVQFNRPHILSQLTDWAGEINNGAGYAAGVTTMAIDGMGSTETIEEGEEFYIENLRQLYTITADVTTSANAATISFYPGLEAAVTDNDDITFVKSSLPQGLEETFAELVVARILVNHAPKYASQLGLMGRTQVNIYISLGERKLLDVRNKLQRASPPKVRHYAPRE